MRILKTNPVLTIINSYLIDSPQPSTISYLWNFGSLLGLCLVSQIVSGIILAMHYQGSASFAFASVEHIMRECAHVLFVKSVLSNTLVILVYDLFIIMTTIKCHDYGQFNKRIECIATWKEVTKSLPWKIIGDFYGSIYDYDKKLETLRENLKYSLVVLSGIWQPLYAKARVNVSRYFSWLNSIAHYKLIVREDNLISVREYSNLAQGSKDARTLKIDKMELGEVTAELSLKAKGMGKPSTSLLVMRTRNFRSINIKLSDDNENVEKGNSDLWTSMKTSNEFTSPDGKKPQRKPVRKIRPDLFVEVSKRLKKYVSKDNRYFNINYLIGDPYFLIACYENIKGKPGNMTKGIDNYTLDGLNGKWFIHTAENLKNGTFQFSPARLKDIPKGDGTMRTLNITSPRDKIVQKAIAVILEAIYEPIFKDTSYGFRPKRSTHDALAKIKLQGAGYSWVIQGDIQKCFDSIPHKIIRRELYKTIGCPNMRALLNKLIAYPIKEDNNILFKKEGTPQGTICSPIIANVVLHLLDDYMEKYQNEFNKGKLKRHNPEYLKLQKQRKKALKNAEYKLGIQLLMRMRRITSFDPMDSKFRRLLYVRYADDFVILTSSTYIECVKIKENSTNFLEENCGLTLNQDKTVISSMNKHFNFLGALIVNKPTKDSVVFDKGIKTWKKAHLRSLIKVPLKAIIESIIKIGLVKRNNRNQIFPKGRTNLFNHSHYTIVKWYNSKVQGILNYYSFASNYPKLGLIVWLLRASCALTLANKYKLKTMRMAFKKFGFKLNDPHTGIEFYSPTSFKVSNDFKNHCNAPISNLENSLNSDWASNLQETSFGKVCCICNSSTDIEMHHLRKVANIRSKLKTNGFSSSMVISAMNRKQIPLCKFHHLELHNGNLTYWEYRKVVEYKK